VTTAVSDRIVANRRRWHIGRLAVARRNAESFCGGGLGALADRPGRTHANCAIIEDSRIVAAKRLDPDSEQGGLDAVLPLFPSAFRELLSATGLTTRDCAGLAISTCGCGFRADANSFQP
jgi:hypothetical protein